jgi:hypothetical protein
MNVQATNNNAAAVAAAQASTFQTAIASALASAQASSVSTGSPFNEANIPTGLSLKMPSGLSRSCK